MIWDWLRALFAAKQPPIEQPEQPQQPQQTEQPQPIQRPPPIPNARGKAIGGVAAASVIATAALFISNWEGEVLNAYQDGGGVWTICDGHTKDVYQGMHVSTAQCREWLAQDIIEHSRGMRACATREFAPEAEAAMLSLTFNIGVAGFCGSSALRRHNAGDDAAACELIRLWNKDNGRVVRGLVNRRDAESKLCRSSRA